jgi:hypothetical protein
MPSFCIGKYHKYTIPQKKLGQNLPWQNWPELILAHFIWQTKPSNAKFLASKAA